MCSIYTHSPSSYSKVHCFLFLPSSITPSQLKSMGNFALSPALSLPSFNCYSIQYNNNTVEHLDNGTGGGQVFGTVVPSLEVNRESWDLNVCPL